MAAPVWSLQLTDLAFNPVGEVLNASGRAINVGLGRVDTASFLIRLDNPLVKYLDGDLGYVKAYRNGVLMFFGPVISTEEAGERESATLAVNAAGAPWVLAHRLVGKTATGFVQATLRDRALIVKDMIDAANAENETHIATTGSISAASASSYQASPYKPLSECLTDLAATLDGFDWRFLPVENFAAGVVTGQKIGTFSAAPVLGSTRGEAIFEWGAGRNNTVSYKRARTRDTQANKVYHNIDAGPDQPNAPTVTQSDADSIAKWGLLEDLAQADILDNGLRQRLVDEHVRVRKNPRQTLEFQPHLDDASGRIPQYGTDYSVADTVRVRVGYNGVTRYDVLMRVWAANFSIDDMGVETLSLTVSDDT